MEKNIADGMSPRDAALEAGSPYQDDMGYADAEEMIDAIIFRWVHLKKFKKINP